MHTSIHNFNQYNGYYKYRIQYIQDMATHINRQVQDHKTHIVCMDMVKNTGEGNEIKICFNTFILLF